MEAALEDRAWVLVVDDDESIRETLSELLRDEGYEVRTAEGGRAALELIERTSPPAVAIVDLMMPEMNGWELIASLRSNHRLSSVPIVVVSAMYPRDLPPDIVFVSKPFDAGEISRLVAAHLR
jgi:CheY-like chemotaxis protein